MAAAQREADLVVEMRAWRAPGARVVGHWCSTGVPQDLYGCRSDWVPATGAEFPRFLRNNTIAEDTSPSTGASGGSGAVPPAQLKGERGWVLSLGPRHACGAENHQRLYIYIFGSSNLQMQCGSAVM